MKINFGKSGGLSAETVRRLLANVGGTTTAEKFKKAKTQKKRGEIARARKNV